MADLRPVIGSEQGGIRPVLIIQNNTGNSYGPTVIIAAVSARQTKPGIPTHVQVGTNTGLDRESVILLEQIRTVDKRRLKYYIGHLDPEKMKRVDLALRKSLALGKAGNPDVAGGVKCGNE